MNDETRKNLIDILQAAEEIQMFTHGMDFKAYQNSPITQRAVERDFEIIGEAASHIPADIKERYSDIPWDKMKAMRNIMIHEYFGVDLETIWKTARLSLTPLRENISNIVK